MQSNNPTERRPTRPVALVAVVIALLLGACVGGSDDDLGSPDTTTTAPQTPTTRDPMSEPTVEGSFAVGVDAHHLVMKCYGKGAPAIVLEAGTDSSGIEVFPTSFIRPLAQEHMTCVYDRLGTGRDRGCQAPGRCSDEPTAELRTLDDLVTDLDTLLQAAEIPGPYLLVGSSGRGLVAAQYARRHPDSVAGVALLDVGVPSPNLAAEFPEEANANNPEHVHWFDAERDLSMLQMPIGDFPVLVVVADGGGTLDQSFWLDLSPLSEQIVMHGGHDLYQEDPDAVADEILVALDPN